MDNKKTIWNVPNILSLLRMILVPVCIASILYTPALCASLESQTAKTWLICGIPTFLFAITSITDMLDGKIARKYNLITDFGKFLDPLADKFMVFGILISILVSDTFESIHPYFIWVTAIVMLRELGVTSLRLVVASKGVVVAASIWGKMKTVTQIFSLILILMENVFYLPFGESSFACTYHPVAVFASFAIVVTTVGSGIDYLHALWPYVTGEK